MRDYQQVTRERYEKDDFSGEGIARNIYSAINPIGSYGIYKEFQLLRHYLKLVKTLRGKCLDELKILDCGCGGGTVTRLTAEILGNAENVYGFEFSQNRLAYCKKMNQSIKYEWGDIVKSFPFLFIKFDAVMAFDVLSHIRQEKDLVQALKNIFNSLHNGGLFLWYDINAKTHFRNFDADTQGFSGKEMEKYALDVGFELIEKSGVHKLISIPLIDKSMATCYLASKINITILEILCWLLPFPYANNVRIFKKKV